MRIPTWAEAFLAAGVSLETVLEVDGAVRTAARKRKGGPAANVLVGPKDYAERHVPPPPPEVPPTKRRSDAPPNGTIERRPWETRKLTPTGFLAEIATRTRAPKRKRKAAAPILIACGDDVAKLAPAVPGKRG